MTERERLVLDPGRGGAAERREIGLDRAVYYIGTPLGDRFM